MIRNIFDNDPWGGRPNNYTIALRAMFAVDHKDELEGKDIWSDFVNNKPWAKKYVREVVAKYRIQQKEEKDFTLSKNKPRKNCVITDEKLCKFSVNLRAALLKREMTQSELARRIGMSADIVNDYCNNRANPSFKALNKICLALNITPDILMH